MTLDLSTYFTSTQYNGSFTFTSFISYKSQMLLRDFSLKFKCILAFSLEFDLNMSFMYESTDRFRIQLSTQGFMMNFIQDSTKILFISIISYVKIFKHNRNHKRLIKF